MKLRHFYVRILRTLRNDFKYSIEHSEKTETGYITRMLLNY